MANVNAKPSYRANLPKTGYDVGQTFNFSSSCGHILPVWYDIASPGEHYSLSTDLFTRTQPLASAPMVDIDEYVDWFFVPFSLIYGNFDSWIYGIDDQFSSLMVEQLKDGSSYALPCIDATGGNYGNLSPKGLPADADVRKVSSTGEPVFENWNRMASRLCDHLEQVPFEALHKGSRFSFPFYNFAAYQCICDRYYRNTQYVTSNVKAYNFDDLLGVPKSFLGWSNASGVVSDQKTTELDSTRVCDLFRLHYRPYALDYFTNVQPSPLQNGMNMLSTAVNQKGANAVSITSKNMLLKVNAWLSGEESTDLSQLTSTNIMTGHDLGADLKGRTPIANLSTTISDYSLATLRQSFAIEKLLSITQRAGKHYDDQTLAHFGIKTDKDKYHDVLCIGQHKQQIHIGEVIATATTAGDESSTLGEIAGKGYGSGDSKKISFDVPCHGIVMACYSCVPRLKRQIEVNKLNMRVHRQDFYQPELDNLGMQPLFSYELNGQPFSAVSENEFGANTSAIGYSSPCNYICAWQYRYMESKVKYDRTSKAFLPEYPFQSWTITTDFKTPVLGAGVVSTGKMFTDYVSSLFCSPNALDQIMLVGYDSSFIKSESDASVPINETAGIPYIYKQVYARDPLFHNLRVNAYKTSSMSAYGLPRLD